jgi:hypothetical protein
VGGLGHHLETAGVSTTAISLIREHTAAIRPPRALWVPFPLGRPFGAPGEPAFQRRVLTAALDLLSRPAGPVLEDFPDDAPGGSDEDGPWACPLPLPPLPAPADERDALRRDLAAEVRRLQPWHEEARRRFGRTAIGVSGLAPERMEELALLVADAAFDAIGVAPESSKVPMPLLLRFAADDLRAFYMEAAAAQPARVSPGPDDLNRWLYHQTVLGDALYRARDVLTAHEDDRALATVGRFMIPAAYNRRPA